jgi:hypothetical protein
MMLIESIQGRRGEWIYRMTLSETEKKFDAHSVADLLLGVEHYFKGNHSCSGIPSCPICKGVFGK